MRLVTLFPGWETQGTAFLEHFKKLSYGFSVYGTRELMIKQAPANIRPVRIRMLRKTFDRVWVRLFSWTCDKIQINGGTQKCKSRILTYPTMSRMGCYCQTFKIPAVRKMTVRWGDMGGWRFPICARIARNGIWSWKWMERLWKRCIGFNGRPQNR